MTAAAILRLLNIRKEEKWLVSKLFWMQFFQGAGVAFFFTAAYATFISNHEAADLSVIYIYSSLFLWFGGFIYTKLEHKFTVTEFSKYVTIFMALSILAFRLFGFTTNFYGFDYIILVWFYVLYLLNNLEFWGIAALVFEVRQSKRLFSIISAGDIPAKFVGYTIASIITKYTGTANLLIPAFISMLLSLPFINAIEKSGVLHFHHHEIKHVTSKSKSLFKNIVKRFTSHGLILSVALLAFVMSVCMTVANFAFYSKIKEELHGDQNFATFIASFLAMVQLVALLVKLFVTGKLISETGLKRSLLLTPLIFLICIILVIVLPNVFNNEELLLYLFGIACIILDVLKLSINSPVFLSMMQPLPIHDRLEAHNIVKGIMDPFAFLFAGIFLFVLVDIEKGINLEALSYWLVLFTVVWMISIYLTDKEYYATVLRAITSKFYTQTDLTIDDNDTVNFIRKKLEEGSESEIIHIIRMIQFRHSAILTDSLMEQLLNRNSDKIKEEILLLYESGEASVKEPLVKEIFEDHTQKKEIRTRAFSILCKSSNTEGEMILPYAEGEEPDLKYMALGCLLNNRNPLYQEKATRLVNELLQSNEPAKKVLAFTAIGRAKNNHYNQELLKYLSDNNPEIRIAAINAAGQIADDELITAMLFQFKNERESVANALIDAGEITVPYINSFILTAKTNEEEKKQLINLCGIIGGDIAAKTLTDLIRQLPSLSHYIVKALYNCTISPDYAEHHQLEDFAEKCVSEAAYILFMQKELYNQPKNFELLIKALDLELLQIRESLFYVFSILFDAEEIEKVKKSFALNNREQTANAMEMVEMTVNKKYSHDFTIIYETGDIEQRCIQLNNKKGASIKTSEEVIRIILRSSDLYFLDWTKACALYTSYRNHLQVDDALIKRYLLAEQVVLRETANYTLHHNMENKLLLLEKVLILKRTDIFSGTPENILADLALLMQETEYAEGALIFEENAIGDSMYIIYQGSVRIHKGNTTLAILDKENDVFGELSLFDAETRSASATAHTDCLLFRIDQQPFYELTETRPEIIKGAVKILCSRLRAQNERTIAMMKTN